MAKVQIVQLLVSPLHRYIGRPCDGPLAFDGVELVQRMVVRKDLGIVGDRYFNQRAHADASVTLLAEESLPTGILADVDLRQTRRNVLLRGVLVDDLIGLRIELAGRAGAVQLAVNRAARPCVWMDTQVGPGARSAMIRTGGVRCTPLSDGELHVGPAELTVLGD